MTIDTLSVTVNCRHCGPVRVTDATVANGLRDTVTALRDGYVPLAAMTCPLCCDEVRSSDIVIDGDALAHFDAEVRR